MIFGNTLAREDAYGCLKNSRNYAVYFSVFFFCPLSKLQTCIFFDTSTHESARACSLNVPLVSVWSDSLCGCTYLQDIFRYFKKILAFADLSFAFFLLLFPSRISVVWKKGSPFTSLETKRDPGLMHSLALCRLMPSYRLPSPSQSNTTVPQGWACFCWFGQGLCDGYWLPNWLHLSLTETPHRRGPV